jgi:hypothetical protein
MLWWKINYRGKKGEPGSPVEGWMYYPGETSDGLDYDVHGR